MTDQPTLPFDKPARQPWRGTAVRMPAQDNAQEAKRDAIERVGNHANPDWKAAALESVQLAARRQPTLTTDDVWWLLGWDNPEHTHEPRAMGAIMQAAARAGWIRATPAYQQSVRVACHARPLRVWESLIFRS